MSLLDRLRADIHGRQQSEARNEGQIKVDEGHLRKDRSLIERWMAQLDKASLTYPAPGADYAWTHPSVAALKAAGVRWVGRYLSHDPSKNLSAEERDELHGNGIAIMLIWESTGTDARAGEPAGLADGAYAREQAAALGAPHEAALYATMDWDVQSGDAPAVESYLRGYQRRAAPFLAGGYGGLAAVFCMMSAGLPFRYQTLAWSGEPTDWSPHAQVRQTSVTFDIGGVSCDRDVALTHCGLWLP